MKKFQIMLLALVAVSAFGAVLAASASAEITLLAEWLINGNPITTEATTETIGAILLEDNKTPFGAAAVLCSGILVGKVGPSGAGSITSVLNLAKEAIGEELVGLALECEGEKLCSTPALVWPALLPWGVLLFLMEGTPGAILVLITGAHYHNECTVLGIKETDLCMSPDIELPVLNDPVTGDAETEGKIAASPNAECSLGGANSGVNETDELAEIVSPSGLLTVSSEGVG